MDEYARIINESPAIDAAEALAVECRSKDAIISEMLAVLQRIYAKDKDWEMREEVGRVISLV